jgi:hypothetical protein
MLDKVYLAKETDTLYVWEMAVVVVGGGGGEGS